MDSSAWVSVSSAPHDLEVPEDHVGCIASSCSHDASSWMGPTSAEIQARERAAVAGMQGHRAGEVELVQGHGAVKYVPSRKSKDSLQIRRCEDVSAHHRGLEARGIGFDAVEHFVRISVFLLLIPDLASSQRVGSVLSEEGDDMAARGSQGGVQRGRDAELNHRPAGRPATHGICEGLMEEERVFTVQVDGALVMGQRLAPRSIGGCQEVGQPVDSHIDLGNR